jgi:hypothetical protein
MIHCQGKPVSFAKENMPFIKFSPGDSVQSGHRAKGPFPNENKPYGFRIKIANLLYHPPCVEAIYPNGCFTSK